MTVTPHPRTLFWNRQDLQQFLAACQQQFKQPQIISVSHKIDGIDPLTALQQFVQPEQLSFYFEQRETETGDRRTIAAFGATAQLETEGENRFQTAQAFVQSTLDRTITVGEQSSLAGPHFFCGFTFFDRVHSARSSFAAATVFLPEWQIVQQEGSCFVTANLAIDAGTDVEILVEQWWKMLQRIQAIHYQWVSPAFSNQMLFQRQDVTDPYQFQQAVRSALAAIHSGQLHKVVQAYAIDISAPLPFHLAPSLHNLRTLYPDCCVFALGNGKGQTFIGASPERLASLQQSHLITDALAGSAPRGTTPREDSHLADRLLTNVKELHEHHVVSHFITQHLDRLGLSPHKEALRLLRLPNIQHLHTPIRAIVPAQISLLDIVAALHPTPAVAGVPRELACAHIRQYEGFERSLYSAPIGWIDRQGNGEFIVGIRSALLDGCTARLFAGAGIVTGSTPDRELAEVQLKLQALLPALV
ncbi:MAG TPA: isochorismate synthase [Thermosynechococcaceae cyanobacterium]